MCWKNLRDCRQNQPCAHWLYCFRKDAGACAPRPLTPPEPQGAYVVHDISTVSGLPFDFRPIPHVQGSVVDSNAFCPTAAPCYPAWSHRAILSIQPWATRRPSQGRTTAAIPDAETPTRAILACVHMTWDIHDKVGSLSAGSGGTVHRETQGWQPSREADRGGKGAGQAPKSHPVRLKYPRCTTACCIHTPRTIAGMRSIQEVSTTTLFYVPEVALLVCISR